MTRNGKIQNNRKAAFRSLQRPIMVSLVSLILLAGQQVMAGEPLPVQFQSDYYKTDAQLSQSPRDAINGQASDNKQNVQRYLGEHSGKPMSINVTPQEAAGYIQQQTGHPQRKSDLPLSVQEQGAVQINQKITNDHGEFTRYGNQVPLNITGTRNENGSIGVTATEFNTMSIKAEGNADKNKAQATGSFQGKVFDIKGQQYTINPDGTYSYKSAEITGPQVELKTSVGKNGVEAKAEASALSGTIKTGVGEIKDGKMQGVNFEVEGKMGVGFEVSTEKRKVGGTFGLSADVQTQNEELPKYNNEKNSEDLKKMGLEKDAEKYLPNKSNLNPTDAEKRTNNLLNNLRENDDMRGDEIMFKPDPGSQPRLVLIDGQYVPEETPIPANGSGILDQSDNRSAMSPGSNSTAQEGGDRRQGMKDKFNSSKQQYDQAARQRQMERDAQAAQSQSNGQMLDFLSIMNSAITAGSAARNTPSTATTGSTSPPAQKSCSDGPSNRCGYYSNCYHVWVPCGPK